MPTPAELWQQRQREVSAATAAAVVQAWAQVRLADPQRTFAVALPQMLAAVVAGQLAAASEAQAYVALTVATDGLRPDPAATVAPRRFAGLTSDGRALTGLLTQPLLRALALRTAGADDVVALAGGRLSLETVVSTEVYDTGRDAVQVAAALDRQVTGYVRQVRTPSCGRCIVLAGRFYRRDAGFSRHPRCDCTAAPATRARSGSDVDQEPRSLFEGMTRGQQDAAFGRDNAEVIRRGGDIGQVVNARRGMATAGSNWTIESTTKRGRRPGASRPSPGALLRDAGDDPDEFARALERAGYL